MRPLYLLIICVIVSAVVCHGGSTDDSDQCTDQCRDGLVCVNSTCVQCQTDEQCETANSQSRCGISVKMGVKERLCIHKPLSSSFSRSDIIAFTIFLLAAAISAGGGVGGGGIFVPVLILVAGFTPKEAIPLSNTIVAGASVANFIQNFPKKHPFANRPLIDYTVALLIEPQTLGGTVFGVFLHQIFPTWLILLLLFIVMGFTAFRTTKKGVATYREEQKRKTDTGILETSHLIPVGSKSIQVPDELQGSYKIPWLKIFALVLILSVSTILSILKGGSDYVSPLGIKGCSPMYWVVTLAVFPLIFVIWGYVGWSVIKKSKKREQAGLPPVIGDVVWTVNRVALVGSVSLLAGVLASLLGVGGGLIKGPVLLELGISPDVTAATSSYMILFTSLSSSIQYILLGKLVWDYGLVLFILGLMASFLGQTFLNYLVHKYGRKSYIIFSVAFVIATSTLLLVITEAVDLFKAGGNHGFVWVCSS